MQTFGFFRAKAIAAWSASLFSVVGGMHCGYHSPLGGQGSTFSSVDTQDGNTASVSSADAIEGLPSPTPADVQPAVQKKGFMLRWDYMPGLCLATEHAQPQSGDALQLQKCAPNLNQQFVWVAGTLRTIDKTLCLNFYSDGPTKVAHLEMDLCSANYSGQKWFEASKVLYPSDDQAIGLSFVNSGNSTLQSTLLPIAVTSAQQFTWDTNMIGMAGFLISQNAGNQNLCVATQNGNLLAQSCGANVSQQLWHLHDYTFDNQGYSLSWTAGSGVSLVPSQSGAQQSPLRWYLGAGGDIRSISAYQAATLASFLAIDANGVSMSTAVGPGWTVGGL